MNGVPDISLGVAFLAGLVSFLSPCVLPLVPSYVTFVTGMTSEELAEGGAARRRAAVHAALFILGFSLVFVALGAGATALGASLRRALPLLQQIGGVLVAGFGLYLLGVIRFAFLSRERRVHLARRPIGHLGSVLVGVTFGAGWTPCVGPVLASILLYAGVRETMWSGMGLLAVYALGLGIPFFVAAVSLNWYLAGARRVRRWVRPIELATGVLLVVVGVLMFTGRYAVLSNLLAGFGQLINVEL